MLRKIIIIVLLFHISQGLFAKDKIDSATKERVLSYIKPIISNQPTVIEPSPIKGLYTVMYDAKVIYVSADGQYLFENASLVDLKNFSDYTEKLASKARRNFLSKQDKSTYVTYEPEPPKEIKHRIAVYTDIDCPYCQKFHHERNNLLKNGIAIDYLAYPRAGLDSDSYHTAVSIWCSKNQKKAMTTAKKIAADNNKARRNGGSQKPQIKKVTCKNPVKDHMTWLPKLGLEPATPQIILSGGELIRGYVPYKKLLEYLHKK